MVKNRSTFWRETLTGPDVVLSEIIKIIDASQLQVAMVVDDQGHLLGTVTDGDVRRAVLGGKGMDTIANEVMNHSPTTAGPGLSRQQILRVMREPGLRQLPIVEEDNTVIGIAHIDDLTAHGASHDNWVVIMAGGLGERLRPLTDTVPKPLLPVGGTPVIELILESFIEQNFDKFYISINYRREMIKERLGDGSRWGVTIEYLEEDERLGTAGALSLIPKRPKDPIIVMNGDLVTRVNFLLLMDYHTEHKATATMCVREYDIQVPYGVININNGEIETIDEKPVHRFFVNAGIYVFEPTILDLIESDSHLDMNRLFEKVIESDIKTAAFPLRERWIDIGQVHDLEKANREHET